MGISFRPQHLKRYKDIAWLLYKYGDKELVKGAGLEETLLDEGIKEKIVTKVDELPDDLENLGPAYVKLGQFLSTRSDILPVQYIEVLQRLQDKVKPFPFKDVAEIFTKETGIRFSKAFLEFDENPIGAASLGQVHKAILRDGKEVVVKIQRPNIREEIIEDLDVFGEVAEFLQNHTQSGKIFMLEKTVQEFRKSILRELDYRNEQQNLKVLANNLKEFKDIIVPLPVDDYSTSKVITMDFVTGIKVTSISPIKFDLDGKKLAETLFKAYMKQIVIDGFYHSDPHPGNVFITDNNKLALLDLGMVGYVSGELQTQLLHMLLAIGDGKGDEVAEQAMKMGVQTEAFNKNEFKNSINELISRNKEMVMENLEIGKLILEVTKISGTNGMVLSNELTMLGKTLLNLDIIGRTLDPKFQPNEVIKRNADELMKKKFKQEAVSQKPYQVLLESKEFIEKLPSRVNKIMDKITNDEFKVKVNAIDEVYLMNGLQKVANRITIGLILASLIIGAALLSRFETSFNIFGYPGLAIILFLLAALGGIVLTVRIMFADEHNVKKHSEEHTGYIK